MARTQKSAPSTTIPYVDYYPSTAGWPHTTHPVVTRVTVRSPSRRVARLTFTPAIGLRRIGHRGIQVASGDRVWSIRGELENEMGEIVADNWSVGWLHSRKTDDTAHDVGFVMDVTTAGVYGTVLKDVATWIIPVIAQGQTLTEGYTMGMEILP